MNIKNLFHRKRRVPVGSADRKPQPLRIEGIGPAPLTPEPDEAELAAQALLEHMCEQSRKDHLKDRHKDHHKDSHNDKAAGSVPVGSSTSEAAKPSAADGKFEVPRDAAYYRQLADRIRQAHEAATQRTLRFVAFVEQELQKPSLPLSGPGSLGLLEAELYKRLDVIERRGGELKKRWQHCLATVIVRRMQAEETTDEKETTDSTD